jgi:branched-chain amino acid transport system ATP-binding protein
VSLLSVRGLKKSFGALAALRDVTFTLDEGEILGIAGPNGSGKSTLFNVLTKIPFAPDGGTVELRGKALTKMSPRAIVEHGLVRIFQTETDFETLSVMDNMLVSLSAADQRAGRADQRARAAELLDFVGIAGQQDRPADEINVYDRKRLMIGTALACRPRVLLLDEPAAGLSKPEIEELSGLIRKINLSGVSIIVIEHIIPLLVAVSHRLLVLNFGEVLAEGDPRKIIADRRVVEAYLGSAHV